MQAFDRELDVRGLNCPLPILRAKKVLGDLTHGPGAEGDGHRSRVGEGLPGLLQADRQRAALPLAGPEFTFFMKKR